MQRAEAGLRDTVGQVCVWLLSVSEVQLSLGNVNHLSLLHHQSADGAGRLSRELVLHWEHMDHHRLDPQEERSQCKWKRGWRPHGLFTHVSLRQVGWLVTVGQRDFERVFEELLSQVLVVDLSLDQVPLQETVHRSSCRDGSVVVTVSRTSGSVC